MNWLAKWIWMKEQPANSRCYIYARREFSLENVPDADLQIACSSHYKLYVNGRYVGRGSARGSSSHQVFDRHDIKRHLSPGRNAIGVICHNSGRGKPGGLLAQITTSQADDPILFTDHRWRVKLACDWDCSSVNYMESYDSRLKPVGWNVVGFDDSGWDEPHVVSLAWSDCWGELIPRLIPKLGEREVLPVGVSVDQAFADSVLAPRNLIGPRGGRVTINPCESATITLDFGCEIIGSPEFRVLDGGVANVDVVYSELPPAAYNQTQTDRIILHGGRQEWQAFGRRTLRYMQLTFSQFDSPIVLGSVAVRSVGYPVRQVWAFECSDPLLNDIYKLGAHTLSLCMQDSYERDPLHDPASHPTDARIQALINHYTFGDMALASEDLRAYSLLLADQADACSFAPEQVLSWILMLHDHYLNTGDHVLVEDLYGCLRNVLDNHLASRETADGLLANSNGVELAAWNAPYYQALRDASKLALALEEFEDAQAWHDKSNAVRQAFNERFWSKEMSSYVATSADCGPSVRANVLAVAFGLADAGRCDDVQGSILANARKLGPSFAPYTLHAMARFGVVSEALGFIRSGWGRMLELGATSCWSRFPDLNGESTVPAGLCRGRCAAPAFFLPAEVLGIKPTLPDSSSALIRPNIGGLEWAKGGYEMRDSRLSVEWRFGGGEFVMDIDGPDGFDVAIPIGNFANPVIHEIDLTPETPERRARKTYGWGDVIWKDGRERDPYLDWLETQEAEPPQHYRPKSRCDLQGKCVWVRQPASTRVRYVVHEGL